ncbi:disulfide bond formation protein B [Gammaproteobacteria bacterium]|nr:disulfide bond formation protein B [Gammaproteobacteria bacterium]MDC0090662.1 disulfide bond formation protein B [Gammaproteobacteria bacterium]
MGIVKKLFFLPSAVNLLVGLGLVIGAYLFQLIGYYDPCPLCILQRWAFGFIAVCGLVLLIPNLYPLINNIILFIASLLSLGGGIIAGRQIYLQHLPADQVPTCTPPMDFLMDTLPFMELIQTILLGDGNCAEYQWRFIFNFAEWALLFYVMLFVYNLYFIFTGFKR